MNENYTLQLLEQERLETERLRGIIARNKERFDAVKAERDEARKEVRYLRSLLNTRHQGPLDFLFHGGRR